MSPQVPEWVVYPQESWQPVTPIEAGLDADKWSRFLETRNVRGAAQPAGEAAGPQWGAALTRGGYLLHTWGDPEFRAQTASVGKAPDLGGLRLGGGGRAGEPR